MAPPSFTEAWISSADFSNRYKLRTAKQIVEENRFPEELPNRIDASSVNSKLDFFRSMGLGSNNFCDINCNNNNDNNGKNKNNDCDMQSCYKRSCRSTSKISECFDDMSEEIFRKRAKHVNSKISSQSRDTLNYRKIIPLIKECSVTIIGEKCKICGRCFKCIIDLRLHTKKKHRKRKPKKNLVIKIGNEVISRVPIKRKHLKCFHKRKHRTIDSSDDATSCWNEEENGCDQVTDEEISPLANLNNHCDTRLIDISAIELQNSEIKQRLDFSKNHEDEDIQVLLKITRPRESMGINHETPNRTERERLLSLAIQEFIRMDDDIIEIIEPNRDLQIYRDDSEIIEEFSRLANNRHRTGGNLDGEEHNCSFHIENEDDVTCSREDVNSLLTGNNDFFSDKTASEHSPHYRNENGDIIPDFIDYSHCLNDRTSLHNNNNNNKSVYGLENLFYNEARINEWNKAHCDPKLAGFDVLQKTSRSYESSVLIKEEIMLDDIFL